MHHEARPLRILARPAFRSGQNPYNSIIYRLMADYGVEVFEYSAGRAFHERFDVVHVHWPDTIFGSQQAFRVLARSQKLLWSLRWQRRHGAKVMWTVHNLKAHDSEHRSLEKRFWQSFPKLVDGFIAMSSGSVDTILQHFPRLQGRPHWAIPHPHYRGQYPDRINRVEARAHLGLNVAARTILFLGQVRHYKNVPALIKAFRCLHDQPDSRFQLVIAGLPRTQEIEARIRQEAGSDPRIRLDLLFLDDDDLQHYLRASDLVVIPFNEILNSGSAILALSFDRPVLMPRSSCSNDLAETVPGHWVQRFDGDLTSAALEAALQAASDLPERTDGDHLETLCPNRVSVATAEAYHELLAVDPTPHI